MSGLERAMAGVRFWVARNVKPVATIKRASVVDGKRGLPQVLYTNIPATLIMPMDRQTHERMMLDTKTASYYTYTNQQDVLEGDTWGQGGQEYSVTVVREWSPDDFAYLFIGLERVKSG